MRTNQRLFSCSVMAGALAAGCGSPGLSQPAPAPSPLPSPAAQWSVGGQVSLLQGSGPLMLQNNSGDDLTVTSSGPFVFPHKVSGGSTYAVTVKSQPPGQFCSARNGSASGTASADVSHVQVTCTVALRSGVASGAPASFDNTSPTYVDISSFDPIMFTTDAAQSNVLLTLYVPRVSGEVTVNAYGQSAVAIEVDGQIVGEAQSQTAYWADASPSTILTVARVQRGAHVVKAKWRNGSTGAYARFYTDFPPALTATVLDSLASFDQVLSSNIAGPAATSSPDYTSYGLSPLALDLAAPQTVLSLLMVPKLSGTARLSLSVADGGGSPVMDAEGLNNYEAQTRPMALAALGQLPAGLHTLSSNWLSGDGAPVTLDALGATLSALAFKPSTATGSSQLSSPASTTTMTYTDVPGFAPVTLTAPRKGQALVIMQVRSASTQSTGIHGSIAIDVGGQVVTAADVVSQNSAYGQAITLVTLVDVNAGAQVITPRFKAGTAELDIDAPSTLSAVFVD